MKKILHMIYGLHIGGAETFLYNCIKQIDNNKYSFSICIQDDNITNKKLLQLCEEKGIKIYIIPKFNRNYLAHLYKFYSLLKAHQYDTVHFHMNALINVVPIYIANVYADKIVLHSHSIQNNSGGRLGFILHKLNRIIIDKMNLCRVACSRDAAKWMFADQESTILDNAVDADVFRFDGKKRDIIRTQLGITGKRVIGHVGRFVDTKNQTFVLDIFESYCNLYKDAVLVFIGDGPTIKNIKNKAEKISREIFFMGMRTDVEMYYSAFDCLVFPSKYEGLPFTLIEAQASGLPIVASDCIPRGVDITNIIQFLSLNKTASEWAVAVNEAINKKKAREMYADIVRCSQYDINVLVEKIYKIYDK